MHSLKSPMLDASYRVCRISSMIKYRLPLKEYRDTMDPKLSVGVCPNNHVTIKIM